MAREVIIKEWCDPCLADDRRVEGTPTPLLHADNSTRAQPRRVALCPQHWAELWEPLRAVLAEYGQLDADGGPRPTAVPSTAPRSREGGVVRGGSDNLRQTPGPFVCDLPECDMRPPGAKNLASFEQHLRHRHRMKFSEYRRDYGWPRRPDGTSVEAPDEPEDRWKCKEPGCEYSALGLKRPAQGLSVHVYRMHRKHHSDGLPPTLTGTG